MLSKDIAQFLEENDLGVRGETIFVGSLKDSKGLDNSILIKDTGGLEPNKYLPIEDKTVQVLVRDVDYQRGYAKAQSIRDLLHSRYDNTTLVENGTDVMYSYALQEVTHIEKDENFREIFTCNYVFRVRK